MHTTPASRRSIRLVMAATLAFGGVTALQADTALTVYSQAGSGPIAAEWLRPGAGGIAPQGNAVPGFAIVRDERELELPAGRSRQRFTDVAAWIDPATVNFVSLTDPATRVLEQGFQFDLASPRKLLARHIGRQVTVERTTSGEAGRLSGTLLSAGQSAEDGLVLRAADGTVTVLRDYSAIRLAELPGGLLTQPTLEWVLSAPRSGKQRVRVSYETGGISWWADYNLVFRPGKDANSGTLDLAAWVNLVNMSGASFTDSRLKLVAGDVQRTATAMAQPMLRSAEVAMVAAAAPGNAGFAEQTLAEFHLYTLGRRVDLPDNSTRQIGLIDEVRQVPARRLLVYRGFEAAFGFGGQVLERDLGIVPGRKVEAMIEFRNDKAAGLGMPLPAGRVRVSQLDETDGSLEFIGEDRIEHTARDELVRIKLGSAFDVVGERRQVDFAIDTRARWLEEEIEVSLRNRKDEPVEVQVIEPMFRSGEWKLVRQSQPTEKLDARQIRFVARVAKNGETVLRYRVRYSW
ncbi:MAG: DUF4139 domain-containing protein [Gammaproteobacteria bacterium]|nr:DUF4139 domain-containing protein [Gammaproteobacteria bacterium]